MKEEDFIKHACEQVLRFTKVEKWNDLSDAVKVQLGFNMGVVSLGLNLSKEDGFLALSNVREGNINMEEFHKHLKSVIVFNNIIVDEDKVSRSFD